MNRVDTRHRRRGVKNEVNRHVVVCYDSRVGWDPVYGKIAGLDTGGIYRIAQVNLEISR